MQYLLNFSVTLPTLLKTCKTTIWFHFMAKPKLVRTDFACPMWRKPFGSGGKRVVMVLPCERLPGLESSSMIFSRKLDIFGWFVVKRRLGIRYRARLRKSVVILLELNKTSSVTRTYVYYVV